jgi:hypothetical protein
MAHMWCTCFFHDPPAFYQPCHADVWITGVIVPGWSGHAAIQDDQGKVTTLDWDLPMPAVVEWGHRYKIGGLVNELQHSRPSGDTLWACAGADAVIPQ